VGAGVSGTSVVGGSRKAENLLLLLNRVTTRRIALIAA